MRFPIRSQRRPALAKDDKRFNDVASRHGPDLVVC